MHCLQIAHICFSVSLISFFFKKAVHIFLRGFCHNDIASVLGEKFDQWVRWLWLVLVHRWRVVLLGGNAKRFCHCCLMVAWNVSESILHFLVKALFDSLCAFDDEFRLSWGLFIKFSINFFHRLFTHFKILCYSLSEFFKFSFFYILAESYQQFRKVSF